ncbi:MAG TPA: Na+/H+ antiporter [Casimicrobiaceae bacterium]|nr:Na+/H+ antiporter [Casimicrobiaceae bacterium]
MATLEVTLGLLLAVAAVGAIAHWVALPGTLLLVLGGVALSFVPALSALHIQPEIFFALFIPPLLFADGWLIPKRDLLGVLRPVLMLAFGLVFATVVAIGLLIHWLVPSLPLAAAFALGAIVSPTDAVATSAATARLPVPSAVTNILNGESLINDASGLVAFKFAVAAVATGAFSLADAAGQVVLLAAGGFAAGVAVAWVIGGTRLKLRRAHVDDPTVQTILSLLTPYAAYFLAESLHVSGILAVVAAGLYSGSHDARHLTLATRRHAWEVWTMLLYVFNGLVFLLLGLELPSVLARIAGTPWQDLALYAIALWAALNVVRLVWIFPLANLRPFLFRKVREREGFPNPRGVFIVGWAGLRGSVTMAAALSIPLVAGGGAPFPGRDLLIFLAASSIVLTLVVNGLTLPAFIRYLGVHGDGNAEREDRAARIALAQAGGAALRESLGHLSRAEEVALARRLVDKYERLLHRLSANAGRRAELDALAESERNLMRKALRAERAELLEMRDAGVINDETMRAIESEIDDAESSLSPGHRRSHG